MHRRYDSRFDPLASGYTIGLSRPSPHFSWQLTPFGLNVALSERELFAVSFEFRSGFDEARKQRMGRRWAALEFGVELAS